MFQYEDLMWLISFPLVCAVMLWFSLDLAVLVRVGGGRRRRANARRAIERLIMNSPVCGTISVVQSPSASPTPHAAAAEPPNQRRGSASGHERLPPAAASNNTSSSTEGDVSTARHNGTPRSPHGSQQYQKVRQVAIPAALRIATRAVVRRAVVLVGGDFARSPRMQYHAASLARSGLFDEVLLVGLDCGNQLSEDLLISGEPQPERFVTRDGTSKGMEHAVYDVAERLTSPEVHEGHGCVISTRYLATPPTPPEWLQAVFPLRSLHWVVSTLYRVVALTMRFMLQTARVTATRINEHGQLLVTDLILVQTPPAVPFILLVKYVVCPMAFLYNVLLYYCVVVPAAWMNPDAMKDLRHECRLQSLRFRTPVEGTANGIERTAGGASSRASQATKAAASMLSSAASKVIAPVCQRTRPWVFYPALVVDWHNYGYTILEQNQRPTTAVQLYKLLEVHLCAGHVNVTVSQAMRQSLERFYPWLKRRALSPLRNGSSSSAEKQTSSDGAESAVTVLYDVAPAFFRPVSRRRCVREVLDRLLRRTSTSPNTAAPPSAHHPHHPPPQQPSQQPPFTYNGGNNASSSNNNSMNAGTGGPYSLVGQSELESLGWGIAGPPAWVYADAAAESPSSPQGSPSSPLPPSVTFGPPPASSTSQRRGVILVGSTSWTEEDDYSVLLRALRRLDHRLNHEVSYYSSSSNNSNNNIIGAGGVGGAMHTNTNPQDLWVLITGKGPARKRFEDAVRAAKLSSHVVVSTYYAQSYQEYSVLLGAADVGFCLHFSSSGLDLPMKGVDMVGAGLPVIALQYPAIEELMGGATRVLAQSRTVVRGAARGGGGGGNNSASGTAAPAALVECERGWVFRSDIDLETLLSSFVGLPPSESAGNLLNGGSGRGATAIPTSLAVMKRRAYEARLRAATWTDNWTRVLLPVLKQVV